MPVQIAFYDTTADPPRSVQMFMLLQDKEFWVGPEIVFKPIDDLPLISRIVINVTGQPEVVVSRLRNAWQSRRLETLVPLTRPRSYGPSRIVCSEPLPSDVRCELTVSVYFYNATLDGKPTGSERMVTASCLLYTGPRPQMPPELTVANMELYVLTGEVTSQTLLVRNPTSDTPYLALAYPETLVHPDDGELEKIRPCLNEFKSAIETVFRRSPHVTDLDQTRREFRWRLDFPLSDRAKVTLGDIPGGLHIPVDAVLPGVRTVRWLLRLESRVKVFPGWVVMDFGTTNSTVALFDIWDYLPFTGLPDEQETYLLSKIVAWMGMTAEEAFGRMSRSFANDWQHWRNAVAAQLKLGSLEAIQDWLFASPKTRLHELVKALELTLRWQPESFRRAAYASLSRFYREALRVPPLQRFRLFPVVLDPDTKAYAISSDMEIQAVNVRRPNTDDRWPKIVMGRRAHKARLEAIGKGEEVPLSTILQRFHPSPKRHFGTDHPGFDVEFDGRSEHVTINQLMRAGWEKLLLLTDEARQEESRFNEGPIRRAIVTYPTVAPPSVRQTIQKLIKDLGISDVRTDYDEAIASAIFHVLREYNTYPELGLELFKSRSRIRTDSSWTQNVLVFDIGGGTTDIALIKLTLTEEPVFPPGTDQGAGGRYYKLTPKLESSTGHMQLGGELMTLRIFYRLKAMIADKLLNLTQEGKIHSEPIQTILNTGLPEDAAENGKYKPGWLTDVVKSENPDAKTPRLREALHLMEQVFPTRWAEGSTGRSAKLQAFYALWDIAEEAKKRLGSKTAEHRLGIARDPYILGPKQLHHLCDQANLAITVKDSKALEIRLTVEEMEQSILKVVQEAVAIAEGALQCLNRDEKVDWLILSGQSCNLRLVDQEIRKTFRKSQKFIWNPQRVTFLPEYAKLSTSIGACYAENQRRSRFAPADSVDDLRRGINVLYFDINNLFSFLPCSFNIDYAGHHRPLFKAGEHLYELYGVDNPDAQRGCARTEWMGAALNVAVYRQDYTDGVQRSWGTFSAQELANQLDFSDKQWQEQIRYQFEVDHRLNMDVMLYRKDQDNPLPHYRLTGNEPRLDVPVLYARACEGQRKGAEATTDRPGEGNPTPPAGLLHPMLDQHGTLLCEIGCGTLQEPSVKTIFKIGMQLSTYLHQEAGKPPLRGMLSISATKEFMPDDTLAIWVRYKDAQAWKYIGLLERPGDKPVFDRLYWFTLDERGILRLHNGRPMYQESPDPQVLKDKPGLVYRAPLSPTKRDTDEDRNPFTGKH